MSEVFWTGASLYGPEVATDEDWASPRFDYLQRVIADLEDPNRHYYGGREWALREAQRWRDARPHLIAHIRREFGLPLWDPRGAPVSALRP